MQLLKQPLRATLSSNTFDTHAVHGFLVAGAENLMLVWHCAQTEGMLNPAHSPVYTDGALMGTTLSLLVSIPLPIPAMSHWFHKLLHSLSHLNTSMLKEEYLTHG